MKTLFIVNPNAGRVRRVWRELKPQLADLVSDYTVVMTHFPEDVVDCLDQSMVDKVERIITVGGDGTNKAMVNAFVAHQRRYPDHDVVLGTIPAGTGQDFARGVGLPRDGLNALHYLLTEAQPRPVDLGQASFAGQTQYFLNASNVGVANDVVQRVERSKKRPWTFIMSVLGALAGYQPEPVQIILDGDPWFEGRIYVVGIANGRSIGQGILLAPDAIVDDGLFDVVVGEGMPLLELAGVFPKIYRGAHIGHRRVFTKRARHVKIISLTQQAIGMDLDGEPSDGAPEITYEIVPAALRMLL